MAREELLQQRAAQRASELIESSGNDETVADLYAAEEAKKGKALCAPAPSEAWNELLAEAGDGDDDQDADDGDDLAAHGFSTSLPSKEIEAGKKRRAQKSAAAQKAAPPQKLQANASPLSPSLPQRRAPAAAAPRATLPVSRAPATAAAAAAAETSHATPIHAHISTPSYQASTYPSSRPMHPTPSIPPQSSQSPAKPAAFPLLATSASPSPMPVKKAATPIAIATKPAAAAATATAGRWSDLLGAEEEASSSDGAENEPLTFTAADDVIL